MKKLILLLSLTIISCTLNQKKKNEELPGRLGDKNLTVNDDERINQSLLQAMIKIGLDGVPPAPTLSHNAEKKKVQEYVNGLEPRYRGVFNNLFSSVELPSGLINETKIIKGDDGNKVKLYITKPVNSSGDMPGIIHLHGGGMAIQTADDSNYVYWRHKLASTGLIVIGVEFRNTAGELGNHSFPAGLNDCVSALKWVYGNKKELGISKIIISGESGGGNLSIATALKAKQDGIVDYIDGVYSQCPFISNLYGKETNEFESLIENNTYFLRSDMLSLVASIYDGPDSRNPIAWPYHADKLLLEGLPPHKITVNELDPLRDEGLAFVEKLTEAGVRAEGKIIKGTVHAAENIFPLDIPEIHFQAIQDIKNFSYGLK
jgi:acetyl esterase/lipase